MTTSPFLKSLKAKTPLPNNLFFSFVDSNYFGILSFKRTRNDFNDITLMNVHFNLHLLQHMLNFSIGNLTRENSTSIRNILNRILSHLLRTGFNKNITTHTMRANDNKNFWFLVSLEFRNKIINHLIFTIRSSADG